MRSPLRWYGGKGSMLGVLLPLMPAHRTYVEPFAGGAAVFFAKAPAPVEVLNDLDSGLVNFYQVLRNRAMFTEFQRLVALTPYSREEFQVCRGAWQTEPDPVERARQWYTWTCQQFGGGGHTSGGWARSVATTNRGRATSVNSWMMSIALLPEIHDRLQQAQIEHTAWQHAIELYDTPETLFYVDPPYVQEERGRHRYAYELSLDDHAALVACLLTVRGRVVLSGYAHAVYVPLESAGWERHDIATAAHTVQTRGEGVALLNAGRVETIWRNPACQMDLGPLFAVDVPSRNSIAAGAQPG